MHPFRPTPKVSPFALPVWVGRNLRRLNRAALLAVGLSVGVPVASSTLTACGQPVLPAVTSIINVVANDLAQGKTDAQIASDVCQTLGGTSSTDAVCANVEMLIADAIQLLIDTGVLKSPAERNARAWQARHPAAAARAAHGPSQAVGQ